MTTDDIVKMIKARQQCARNSCKYHSEHGNKKFLREHQERYRLYDELLKAIKFREDNEI